MYLFGLKQSCDVTTRKGHGLLKLRISQTNLSYYTILHITKHIVVLRKKVT